MISSVQNESAGHTSNVETTSIPPFCVRRDCHPMPTDKEIVASKKKTSAKVKQ